jgi:hypothetical protein
VGINDQEEKEMRGHDVITLLKPKQRRIQSTTESICGKVPGVKNQASVIKGGNGRVGPFNQMP